MPQKAFETSHALLLSLLLAMLTFPTWGCERSGQRIKMAKPPSPLVSRRHPTVRGNTIAGSRSALLKSAQLSPSEAVAALGGFVYHAKANYTYQRGQKVLRLKEKYQLEQHSSGAFRAVLSNDKDKGYEVRWVGEALYQKARRRPFRVISKEASSALRWQQRGFGRWRAMVGIFGRQLALTSSGETSYLQRSCVKYQISLHSSPQKVKMPKEGTAWAGSVPDHTRGAAAKQPRVPLSASGHVWIDQKSGVVLKVKFRGRYQIGSGKQPVKARIELDAGFASMGDPTIAAPKKVQKILREPDPIDPFAGSNRPSFLLPPPTQKKKRRRRRRKRKKRR